MGNNFYQYINEEVYVMRKSILCKYFDYMCLSAEVGMEVRQAVWYLTSKNEKQTKRKAEFVQLENPMDILKLL